MTDLFYLAVLPATLAILSLVIGDVKITRKLIPSLIWWQLAIAAFILKPCLTGAVDINFAPDLAIDKMGSYFILLTTFVVSCCVTHADYYFSAAEAHGEAYDAKQLKLFYGSINLFLLAMTSVFVCDNLGYLWMAIEATTLSSAPLVYFERNKFALEATWKYLIVCSVGIAFALLGTVFIFAASQRSPGAVPTLNISELIATAQTLNYPLLRLGFIFCLIGYGTKAGIFPLHTWLPDAHAEAPAPASAMLSGSLLNCALFGIWKVASIINAAQPNSHVHQLVSILGTVTIVAASLLLLRQHNFKRLWAYSSIENVGLMLFAIGLNSGPLFFLQALNHSVAKVALFLLTGNIIQATGTKKLNKMHGIIEDCPLWAGLLALATFAVTGAPPFGAFVAEMSILSISMDSRWIQAMIIVVAIAISFIAICHHVGKVILGPPKQGYRHFQEIRGAIIPAILVFGSLALGLVINTEAWSGAWGVIR
jgi:hydrogenase-4 component F